MEKTIIIIALILALIGISVYFIYKISGLKKEVNKLHEENLYNENMRRDFVANITHDLKTPLTSILGFVETLQSGNVKDEDTRNRFFEIIAIETSRLNRLIDDVLALSDIEGEKNNSEEVFYADKCCYRVADLLFPIARLNGISINVESEKNVAVRGDEDRFVKMIMNLVENAIKYGKSGGYVNINIRKNQNNIMVKVADDGIGIGKEHIDRVTERFYRVDKSRSKKIGGTGLGLSIVKHTVALFDGTLEIQSEMGKGTTFIITIPTAK